MPAAATHFADPVHDAQQTFRCVLEAMARPARWHVVTAAPAPLPGLSPAATALALTLLDHEVAVWLGPGARASERQLRFSNAVVAVGEPAAADFAFLAADEYPGLAAFAPGRPVAPEQSTTAVIDVRGHTGATGLTCTGPGLAEPTELFCDGLPSAFATDWSRQSRDFPLGVDVLLTAADRVAALPRSVRLGDG